MPEKRTKDYAAMINRYLNEGRGQGALRDYRPWLTIQDVPSNGRVHRALGWKTDRVHHLLSDIEYRIFLLLDTSQQVADIREQFPLDRDVTEVIARDAEIAHPRYPGSRELTVMTTDFLVTVGRGRKRRLVALAAKPADDLSDRRVLEKLEIERRYWEQKDVPWYVITDRGLPAAKIRTLDWLHGMWDLAGTEEPENGYQAHAELLVAALRENGDSGLALNQVCNGLDGNHRTASGLHLLIARHLFAHHALVADMNQESPWSLPLADIRVDAKALRLVPFMASEVREAA